MRPSLSRALFIGASVLGCVAISGPALAAGPASGWHIGYYTPSPIGAQSSASAATPSGGGIATLNFTSEDNTALLTTYKGSSKGSLLGNLTGKTISATATVSNVTGTFTYYGEPSCDNRPANVRLYFQTSNAGGFDFANYWWSNPISQDLVNGEPISLTVNLDPAKWSDYNGTNGALVPDGFAKAVANVTEIGVSFGGGCFFENGVGTTDGSGTFTLNSFSVS